MRYSFPAAALAAFVFLGACASSAPPAATVSDRLQPRPGLCGDRATVTGALAQLGETPEGAGADAERGEIVELWIGPEGFSVLASNRFGATCVIATGSGWRHAS